MIIAFTTTKLYSETTEDERFNILLALAEKFRGLSVYPDKKGKLCVNVDETFEKSKEKMEVDLKQKLKEFNLEVAATEPAYANEIIRGKNFYLFEKIQEKLKKAEPLYLRPVIQSIEQHVRELEKIFARYLEVYTEQKEEKLKNEIAGKKALLDISAGINSDRLVDNGIDMLISNAKTVYKSEITSQTEFSRILLLHEKEKILLKFYRAMINLSETFSEEQFDKLKRDLVIPFQEKLVINCFEINDKIDDPSRITFHLKKVNSLISQMCEKEISDGYLGIDARILTDKFTESIKTRNISIKYDDENNSFSFTVEPFFITKGSEIDFASHMRRTLFEAGLSQNYQMSKFEVFRNFAHNQKIEDEKKTGIANQQKPAPISKPQPIPKLVPTKPVEVPAVKSTPKPTAKILLSPNELKKKEEKLEASAGKFFAKRDFEVEWGVSTKKKPHHKTWFFKPTRTKDAAELVVQLKQEGLSAKIKETKDADKKSYVSVNLRK